MAHTLVFSHTYPYRISAGAIPVRRPLIPVRLYNAVDRRRGLDVAMLVDSGADTT